jgi:hypothetical protein
MVMQTRELLSVAHYHEMHGIEFRFPSPLAAFGGINLWTFVQLCISTERRARRKGEKNIKSH